MVEPIKELRIICRKYNDKDVTREEIIELLNDAVYAPTHKFRQTWRFILIDREDKELLINHMDELYKDVDPKVSQLDYRKSALRNAKMILVVLNEKENPDPIWMLEEYGAASALIQNFSLLAYEKGIGVCWKSHFFLGEPGKFIGVKDNEMITGVLTIGRYDEAPSVEERIKVEDKLTIFKFNK